MDDNPRDCEENPVTDHTPWYQVDCSPFDEPSFCTNDRHMRNKRLHHSMYADTMKASVPSTSKDMYALSPSRSKDFYVSLLTSSGQRRSR